MCYSFPQVLGFFFICLWIVPFSIFISLTANDMVLPTLGGPDGANTGRQGWYGGIERAGLVGGIERAGLVGGIERARLVGG